MSLEKSYVLFLLVACVCFCAVSSSSLIDKWGRCKITDPDLSGCLTKACEKMIIDLRGGNQEFKIPPFEPFQISKMALKSGGKGPVNLELIMEDTYCVQITDFTELSVDTSKLKDMEFRLKVKVPHMNITTKYTMNGRVLTVPIKGKGDARMASTDCYIELIIKGKPLEKNGKKYWQVNVFDITFNPTKLRMEYTGLFNGDKKLGDAANKILNENWKAMNREFQPFISSEFAKTALPIANIITQMEPFEEMFPK